jgi:peptide/nickel transport system substrate-binding protein
MEDINIKLGEYSGKDVSRRAFVKCASVLGLGAFISSGITACVDDTGTKTDTNDGGAVGKDEVIIGFTSFPTHFDPLQGFGTGGQIIFSPLVNTDVDMNIIPDLCESYEISPDGKTYSFALRKDALFSDGTPVTAQDVVFSYKTLQDGATNIDLSMVGSITASGDNVTITLNEQNPTFILTVTQIGIAPEQAYGEDFGLSPIGSGPYKLVQFDVDQQFILEANELYYGDKPSIRRAVFLKMADADARLVATSSGQVDIVPMSSILAGENSIDGYDALSLKTVNSIGVMLPTVPANSGTSDNGITMGHDITCDTAIRKAFAYSIDRDEICELLYGFARPAFSENDGMPWNNPECAIKTDVEYAKKLLAEAGWTDSDGDGVCEKNGVKASFKLYYTASSQEQQLMVKAIAQHVIRAGIEIECIGVGFEEKGELMFFEAITNGWGSSNPMTSYYLYHSSSVGKDDWYNPESFSNKTVDGYFDDALQCASLEESTPYWQKAQWDGKTGTSMRGEAPFVIVMALDDVYFVRKGLKVGNQKIHAHGGANWGVVANLKDWTWE